MPFLAGASVICRHHGGKSASLMTKVTAGPRSVPSTETSPSPTGLPHPTTHFPGPGTTAPPAPTPPGHGTRHLGRLTACPAAPAAAAAAAAAQSVAGAAAGFPGAAVRPAVPATAQGPGQGPRPFVRRGRILCPRGRGASRRSGAVRGPRAPLAGSVEARAGSVGQRPATGQARTDAVWARAAGTRGAGVRRWRRPSGRAWLGERPQVMGTAIGVRPAPAGRPGAGALPGRGYASGRTTALIGMEPAPASVTLRPGRGAWTIAPSPTYMPTWLASSK